MPALQAATRLSAAGGIILHDLLHMHKLRFYSEVCKLISRHVLSTWPCMRIMFLRATCNVRSGHVLHCALAQEYLAALCKSTQDRWELQPQ